MFNSGSRFVAWSIAFILLLVVPNALAQVSRVAVDSVRGEHLELQLRDDQLVRGHVRALDTGQVIILADDGELHDLKLRDVTRIRVIRSGDALPSEAPSVEPEPTSAPADRTERAPRDETSELPPRAFPPFGDDQDRDEAGYLGDESRGGYLPGASEREAATRPPQNILIPSAPPDPTGRLYLNQADYNHFQAIRGRATVRRIVGWTFLAVGAAFIVNGAMEKRDAVRWGEEYNAKPQYITGAIMAAAGMPLVVLGRRGHRQAGQFAREAAEGRRALAAEAGGRNAASSRHAAAKGIQPTPDSMLPPPWDSTTATEAELAE